MSQQPNSFGFQTNASGGSGGNTNVANADNFRWKPYN